MHSRSSLHSRVSWGTFGAHTGKTAIGLDDEVDPHVLPRLLDDGTRYDVAGGSMRKLQNLDRR
jgi:hypothetical protein